MPVFEDVLRQIIHLPAVVARDTVDVLHARIEVVHRDNGDLAGKQFLDGLGCKITADNEHPVQALAPAML